MVESIKEKERKKLEKRVVQRFLYSYKKLLRADGYNKTLTESTLRYALGIKHEFEFIKKLTSITNYCARIPRAHIELSFLNPDKDPPSKYYYTNLLVRLKKPKAVLPKLVRGVDKNKLIALEQIICKVRGIREPNGNCSESEQCSESGRLLVAYKTTYEVIDAMQFHSYLCKSLRIPMRGAGIALIRSLMARYGWTFLPANNGFKSRYQRLVH